MRKIWPNSVGILAAGCFVTERCLWYFHMQLPYVRQDWLQLGFVLVFTVQVILTSLLHFKDPDKHLEGSTLTILFTNMLLFLIAVPLYHLILRSCELLVNIADQLLP